MKVPEFNICNNNGIQKLNLVSSREEVIVITYDSIVRMMNSRYNMNKLSEEYAYVLSYGDGRKLLAIYQISHNYPSSTILRNRELFTFLLLSGAKEFFVVHNHPFGGSNEHSEGDIRVINKIKEASEIIGIDFVASIVINLDGYSVYENKGWTDDWIVNNLI